MRIDRILCWCAVAAAVTLIAAPAGAQRRILTLKTEAGDNFEIDTSEAPDLTDWAAKELAPVVQQWYPKIVKMLPSDGFNAPRSFEIKFSATMRGVAATRGIEIECGAHWFRHNLDGEAKGAVVHELVHVAQQYGRARRGGRRPQTPGWLVEGIADYIRWFLYEPASRGAEISARRLADVHYDDSYRVSANFLSWVTEHHDRDIVPKLNAALREGRYQDDLWTEWTNRPVEELGDEWKSTVKRSFAAVPADNAKGESPSAESSAKPSVNSLSEQEKSDGWQLLFNGHDFTGWHSFGRDGVRPGWQIKDGALTCADPSDAGDLCTNDEFEWFELKLEYNISKGGNSGIMFRVTDKGSYAWETGPELQLADNARARDAIRSGWLYALYQPPDDRQTGKPLDATKPAGQWNEVRLLVSPEECVHEVNGVKYLEYVLGSDDFQNRVAKSKFHDMPLFAKASRGRIALQGDHGQIAFRRIRIRTIEQSPASAIRPIER